MEALVWAVIFFLSLIFRHILLSNDLLGASGQGDGSCQPNFFPLLLESFYLANRLFAWMWRSYKKCDQPDSGIFWLFQTDESEFNTAETNGSGVPDCDISNPKWITVTYIWSCILKPWLNFHCHEDLSIEDKQWRPIPNQLGLHQYHHEDCLWIQHGASSYDCINASSATFTAVTPLISRAQQEYVGEAI